MPGHKSDYLEFGVKVGLDSKEAQNELLIAKTASIKYNLSSENEEHIYEFNQLLEVLKVGWDDESVLDIAPNCYNDVVHAINSHY